MRLIMFCSPISSAYPIDILDAPAMFDPLRRDELNERIANSDFVHLWNEYWRRVRIPKELGPPKGSFLDGLFARFGFSFDDEARLSADAVAAWFEEFRFLAQMRRHLQARYVPGDALDRLIGQPDAQISMPASAATYESQAARIPVQAASRPQTVRSFWASGAIGPYQLLGLRSFADRGHRVEVFTFDRALKKPSWITWRDAAEIVPAARIVRELAEPGQSAIHANLFRHALLHRHGGWWVDPDVVLLGTELPDTDTFFARSHDTQLVSPAAMKFPESHPTLAEALIHSAPFDDKPEQWDKLGAALLTECLAADGLLDRCQPPDVVSPVSWFDVEILFDPARADMVEDKLKGGLFLDLHQEAWLRAGVPRELGPPLGSYLDRLFKRHEIGWPFAARIEYGDLRRWFAHMYRTTAADSGFPGAESASPISSDRTGSRLRQRIGVPAADAVAPHHTLQRPVCGGRLGRSPCGPRPAMISSALAGAGVRNAVHGNYGPGRVGSVPDCRLRACRCVVRRDSSGTGSGCQRRARATSCANASPADELRGHLRLREGGDGSWRLRSRDRGA